MLLKLRELKCLFKIPLIKKKIAINIDFKKHFLTIKKLIKSILLDKENISENKRYFFN